MRKYFLKELHDYIVHIGFKIDEDKKYRWAQN